MKGIYIFLAEGFEDMEGLATLDILRRGGLDVNTVSITDDPVVTSSHGVTVYTDLTFDELLANASDEASREDVLIFPGGMPGSRNLAGTEELMRIMKNHYIMGGTVAAICAAPGLVLSQLSSVSGLAFTCFDGFEAPMIAKGAVYTPESVVIDGRMITGRGAGHAVNFGLHILAYLKGEEAVAKVKAGLML
ncbi:MAG: DJ-1/PfpI family protein [Bacteroidales bacterium]|nr:DJ-1/PfpI family protein [Bacteroidales bacterium]